MTFDPIDCWGCPLPVLLVVLGLVIGIGLLATGLIVWRRNLPGRLGGSLLLVLAGIWYFIFLRAIIRLGSGLGARIDRLPRFLGVLTVAPISFWSQSGCVFRRVWCGRLAGSAVPSPSPRLPRTPSPMSLQPLAVA